MGGPVNRLDQIQDGGRPPFWKTENGNNSAAVWAIAIKFGVMVDMDSLQRALTSFLTCIKFKISACRHFEKKENSHNWAAISDIYAKFGVLVALHNLQRPVMSFFGYNKIQDQIQDGGRPPYCPKIESGITPVLHKIEQESPAVADKPARRLRKVQTVYVRAVGL